MKRFFSIFILLILLSSTIPTPASAESKYISLKGSCIYHKIDGGCGKVKETNPDNLLFFDTVEEAKLAGCTRCSNCFGIGSEAPTKSNFIMPQQINEKSPFEQGAPYATKYSTKTQSRESNSTSDLEVVLGGIILLICLPMYGFYQLCQFIDNVGNKQEQETPQQIPEKPSPPKEIAPPKVDLEERARIKEINAQILNRRMELALQKGASHLEAPQPPAHPTPKAEPKRTSSSAQTQSELDSWKKKWKQNDEIGREYERFIGYLCETRGYKVAYFGATKGKSDLGRDLIVQEGKKAKEIFVIQCKYWGKDKIVREKHINQIYGTTIWMAKKDPEHVYRPIFVTNIHLSDEARDCADIVGVKVYEGIPMEDRPLIKCNIGKNGKIYHLPFEQGYDTVQISGKKGCFYAWSVKEAEEKGFRRSHYNIDSATPTNPAP